MTTDPRNVPYMNASDWMDRVGAAFMNVALLVGLPAATLAVVLQSI